MKWYIPCGLALSGLAILTAGLFYESNPLIIGGVCGFLAGGLATLAVAVWSWWMALDRISFAGVVGIVVIGLYVASCFLPACSDQIGLVFLLLPLLRWSWLLMIPWSPNVFLVLGLVSLGDGHHRKASLLGTVGAVPALIPLFMFRHGLMVGYYLWLASFVTLAVGAAIAARRVERDRASTSDSITSKGESDMGAAA